MVPNPWYIGNSAQKQKASSDQLSLPHFSFDNLNRISNNNKIGMSKGQNSHPLQNVSVKHMQKLLDLVKRSSVSNCQATGEYIQIPFKKFSTTSASNHGLIHWK